MVPRVKAAGLGEEGSTGTMFKALIDGQDHKLTRAADATVIDDSQEIFLLSRRKMGIPTQNVLDSLIIITSHTYTSSFLCSILLTTLVCFKYFQSLDNLI